MNLVKEARPAVGIAAACDAVGLPRSSFYRALAPLQGAARPPRTPRKLSAEERAEVLALLHEDRFIDLAPVEVYATLLDEKRYVCSIRTMHRILAAHQEARDRRDQRRHPAYVKPELLATGPNQLWSWDITKLKGPAKWTYYHLYVILDVFSRYVVGWMLAHRESARLAERLIAETCKRQKIKRDQLTIHADRGTSMRSKPVALLLSDLGVTKTHSRPHVSNDNPMSEAQFKTLKYRPDYPERFGGIEDARAFHVDFFDWYNTEHHHSSLVLLTPSDVHHGRGDERILVRQGVLAEAYAAHPERFPLGLPQHAQPPTEVWINKPAPIADGGRPPQAKAGSSDTPKGVAPPTLVDAAAETDRTTGDRPRPCAEEGVALQ
jgi:putative transposase